MSSCPGTGSSAVDPQIEEGSRRTEGWWAIGGASLVVLVWEDKFALSKTVICEKLWECGIWICWTSQGDGAILSQGQFWLATLAALGSRRAPCWVHIIGLIETLAPTVDGHFALGFSFAVAKRHSLSRVLCVCFACALRVRNACCAHLPSRRVALDWQCVMP